MNRKSRVYIIVRGNEVKSILVDSDKGAFKREIYPYLLQCWHIVHFQRLDELHDKATKVDLHISKYWERKLNEVLSKSN